MSTEGYLYTVMLDGTARGIFPALVRAVARLLSIVYRLVIVFLIALRSRRKHAFPCKVVSIGNITVGGTGKTPLVGLVARFLKANGRAVAIVTRGYMRRTGPTGRVQSPAEAMGDEAYMLSLRLPDVPVIVDADRCRGIRRAVERHAADTVILDDGFQQWGIRKDLDIVAIDTDRGFGNGCMLPRGILREPLGNLHRADMFCLRLNGAASPEAIEAAVCAIKPDAQVFRVRYHPEAVYPLDDPGNARPVEVLKGKSIGLVCGIANPTSFETVAQEAGLCVGMRLFFPDHYAYTKADIQRISAQVSSAGVDAVLITEKDAVKIAACDTAALGAPAFVMRIAPTFIQDEKKFYRRLLQLYTA